MSKDDGKIGGIWNPWNGPKGDDKAFSDMLDETFCKPESTEPSQPEPPKPADIEAAVTLALTLCAMSNVGPTAFIDEAIADSDEWRIFMSAIASRAESGEARELLNAARQAYRQIAN